MPARARDLARALTSFGCTVQLRRSGSHYRIVRGSVSVSYSLSLHNGMKTEVSDVYIKGLCRAFGIDEAELRNLL